MSEGPIKNVYKHSDEMPHRINYGESDYAINLSDIVKQKNSTGKISIDKNENSPDEYSLTADFNKNDQFNKEYDALLKSSLDKFKNDKEIKSLLAKEKWDDSDREKWEQKLNSYVYDEMQKHPLFKGYRNEKEFEQRSLNTIKENGPFDCEHIHLIKGMVMQEIENTMLKDNNEGIKKPTAYYYLGHNIFQSMDGQEYVNGGHAAIISGTTFAVANYGSYHDNYKNRTKGEPYDMESFKNAEPIIAESRSSNSYNIIILGDYDVTIEQVNRIAAQTVSESTKLKLAKIQEEFHDKILEANKSGGGISPEEYKNILQDFKEEIEARFSKVQQNELKRLFGDSEIDYKNLSPRSGQKNEDQITILGEKIAVHLLSEPYNDNIRKTLADIEKDFREKIQKANKSGDGIDFAEYKSLNQDLQQEIEKRFSKEQQVELKKMFGNIELGYKNESPYQSDSRNEDRMTFLGKEIFVHLDDKKPLPEPKNHPSKGDNTEVDHTNFRPSIAATPKDLPADIVKNLTGR